MHPHNCVTEFFQSFDAVGYDHHGTILAGYKALHFVVAFFLEFLIAHT